MLQGLTKEEFSKRYDELFQQALAVFAKYNPCKVKDCDGVHTCVRGREDDIPSFCCYGCAHLTEDGCAVECLWCKLWFCQPPSSSYYQGKSFLKVPEEFFKELRMLRKEASNLGMLAYRASKEELMKEVYESMDSTIHVFGGR